MRRLFSAVSIAVALGGMLGCAAQPSRVEMDYGTSHKLAIANQVLSPEAGQNLAPVEGLNGDAAQKVYDRYTKQFERPEREPVYVFSVGPQGAQSR
jgi:hypothetical protein